METKPAAGQKILVAMSGGVDSSIAAAVLLEQGYSVMGATMNVWSHAGGKPRSGHARCGDDGVGDARRVCDTLGIPHHVFDFQSHFMDTVIRDFVDEYASGRTPNPCVLCNSRVKIPELYKKGRELGAEFLATGHYARIHLYPHGGAGIFRASDSGKDQTYFLWNLPSHLLPQLRFPLGNMTKDDVRTRARHLGLSVADKPESQDICFVPGTYVDFLRQKLGSEHPALSPGPVVSASGELLGRHTGYAMYTVGQRKGLGGGRAGPVYVLGVRPETREVLVGTGDQLRQCAIRLGNTNWLTTPPQPGERLLLQIRYGAAPEPAQVEHIGPDRIHLSLSRPQRAVTPGQSGVIYRDDELVGGGRII